MNSAALGGVEDPVLRAELASRQSLLELTTNADDVLHSFSALVDAATDLSARMAHPSQGIDHSMAIARLAEMTRAVVDLPWPAPTQKHPHVPAPRQLDQAANLLRQAACAQPEQLSAGAAQRVRARMLHTVYVASHFVEVSLREEVRTQISRGERQRAAGVQALRDRVSTIEHVASAAVNGRPHQWSTPEPAMSRLSAAFAEWDIKAHRVLAGSPTGATLEAIALTQALATRTSDTLIGAAMEAGHLSRDAYQDRLGPALRETAHQWSALRGHLSEFTTARTLPPVELVKSSQSLRAAMRDVVLDRGATASAATIAARVDVVQAAGLARQSIGAGTDLALMARDVATGSHQINGPAAVVNRKLKEFNAQLQPGTRRDPLTYGLSVRDLTLGRDVMVPSVLRTPMVQSADLLAQHSMVALSAAAGARTPGLPSAGGAILAKGVSQSLGRSATERTLPAMGRELGPSVPR
ncbi:hypothetical protein [Ornithinimicrobium murale]|uniref:hypothetical protein n=1 Tax=Ornithinimicrobium murale TaxID=1050153 RepID=UPI0013B3BC95|nr:hypothetical protein [Ornithinimicrobium murale]